MCWEAEGNGAIKYSVKSEKVKGERKIEVHYIHTFEDTW
jgi:hypothetical protein